MKNNKEFTVTYKENLNFKITKIMKNFNNYLIANFNTPQIFIIKYIVPLFIALLFALLRTQLINNYPFVL